VSFDKHYPNRKDKRKQYFKIAQRCDRSCRCHGGCKWCESNRLHSDNKKKLSADEKLKEK